MTYKDIIVDHIKNLSKPQAKKWLEKMYKIFSSLEDPDYNDKVIMIHLYDLKTKIS